MIDVYLIVSKNSIVYAAGVDKEDTIRNFNILWGNSDWFTQFTVDDFDADGNLILSDGSTDDNWRLIKACANVDSVDDIYGDTEYEKI